MAKKKSIQKERVKLAIFFHVWSIIFFLFGIGLGIYVLLYESLIIDNFLPPLLSSVAGWACLLGGGKERKQLRIY